MSWYIVAPRKYALTSRVLLRWLVSGIDYNCLRASKGGNVMDISHSTRICTICGLLETPDPIAGCVGHVGISWTKRNHFREPGEFEVAEIYAEARHRARLYDKKLRGN